MFLYFYKCDSNFLISVPWGFLESGWGELLRRVVGERGLSHMFLSSYLEHGKKMHRKVIPCRQPAKYYIV